ncbi:hypothetical protein H5410_052043 [Solanum commersonii]|uniref:Uncharacterized protein n=1 Tax=Solanum commersonii TaxID=4109 RepID=A0A9J5X2W0_SOLCO|nr:hypothetical protein H5410_052043 [Solanum commersonii]
MGGYLHTRNVEKAVDKLATIIPLFLASTGFYGKRLDLYFNKLPAYVDKPQSKLKVVFIKNVSQQDPSSNDYGLYACLFAKYIYISNGVFYMGLIDIDAKYHRKRYATIMWQYGRSKNADGTIGKSEVTGMVASKFDGSDKEKEHA